MPAALEVADVTAVALMVVPAATVVAVPVVEVAAPSLLLHQQPLASEAQAGLPLRAQDQPIRCLLPPG